MINKNADACINAIIIIETTKWLINFSSLLTFIRKYIKKNIRGITRENTETLFTVSVKNIGIKPEINDENSAAPWLLVISFAIRYIIK